MNHLPKVRQSLTQHSLDPFTGFHHDISHALDEFCHSFEPQTTKPHTFENLKFSPMMDLVEDKTCYKLEVEMPGLDEKDLKLSVRDNILVIEGEKTTSHKDKKKNFVSREISYGRYMRTVILPLNVNLDKIAANFKKGMLWVTIPKMKVLAKSNRQIKIKKAE